ncbi:MAG TPA: Ig-like domain-containing protein [Candidatus Krumholzibacteria bacterium]|nr:Ig-like domain-containing protein [Candidatus Krumholzibacteria bacterium]
MRTPPRSQRPLILAFFALIALVSCSDDTPVGTDTSDHTAPQIATLTPIDEYHVDLVFDEELDPTSSQNWQNYTIVETNPAITVAKAPGDGLYPTPILGADHKTVSLVTYYSMSGLPLELSVSGIKDVHGNSLAATKKSFSGSNQPDVTPPSIASSTPAAGANDAPVGTFVIIRFSEPLGQDYYEGNITWTSPDGPVDFYMPGQYSSASSVTLIARHLLAYNATQTISLAGLKDRSGNPMADTQLSFTTTAIKDSTKPTLISSFPADGAVHVDDMTTISLTFSEPINRFHFDLDFVPSIPWDEQTWSNGSRTVTYTLRDDLPLDENQQYQITVYPNGVFDLAGNTVPDFQRVLFTTGQKLEQGQISGRIKGDPNTPSANPTGTLVVASNYFWDTYNYGKVPANGTYFVKNLQSGPYLVRGYFDSNHDGVVNIQTGDALGGYGADIDAGDFELEFVGLGDGDRHSGIDFQIYDPTATSGYTSYAGTTVVKYRPVQVGLFASANDAAHLQNPLFTYDDWWAPWKTIDDTYPDWVFNQFLQVFDEGTYYVAAYLDADSSLTYDPGIDPAGVYGGFASPTPLVMTNGKDYQRVMIAMSDPPTARATSRAATRTKWPAPVKNAGFQQFVDAFAKARAEATLGQRNSSLSPVTVKR